MKKMIIIDDERLIRNGLLDYLNWNELGIEIVALCANGQEGLEAIHLHNPDIVLSDVCMPIMDGVQLLKTIRLEGLSDMDFIFISSYSEFRYAQEAIKYNAFDYLLKPLEASVLEECIRRCIDKRNCTVNEIKADFDYSLAKDLLRSVLLGLSDAESALSGLLENGNMQLKEMHLLIRINTENDEKLNAYSNIVKCDLDDSCSVVLLNSNEYRSFQNMQQRTWIECQIVQPIYDQFCRTLLNQWLEDHQPLEEDATNILSTDYWLYRLRGIARELLEHRTVSYSECWQCCWDELLQYRQQLERIELQDKPFAEICTEDFANIKQIYSLLTTVLHTGVKLSSSIQKNCVLSPYTTRALNYIAEHYHEDVKVFSLAHSLGISKSHLCATFKNDMDCSFGEYLFAYRMKIAKELLKKNELSITEIGERVGYPDLARFSKRFKQYYAVSPREMIKRAL